MGLWPQSQVEKGRVGVPLVTLPKILPVVVPISSQQIRAIMREEASPFGNEAEFNSATNSWVQTLQLGLLVPKLGKDRPMHRSLKRSVR